jgi:hypothetical protein
VISCRVSITGPSFVPLWSDERGAAVQLLVGGDILGDHVVQAPGIPRLLHDPSHLLVPLPGMLAEIPMVLDGDAQAPP